MLHSAIAALAFGFSKVARQSSFQTWLLVRLATAIADEQPKAQLAVWF
jgi:hypothetical protein